MKVGLLGGTFDPPHLGHLMAAEIALQEVDQVIWIPSYKHAFGKKPVSFKHRSRMVREMIGYTSKLWVTLIEKLIDEPQWTENVVYQFVTHGPPGQEYRFILGEKDRKDIHRWHDFDEVARLAPPLWITMQDPHKEISSTRIRELLIRGIEPEGMLHDNVLKYIKENQLYI